MIGSTVILQVGKASRSSVPVVALSLGRAHEIPGSVDLTGEMTSPSAECCRFSAPQIGVGCGSCRGT